MNNELNKLVTEALNSAKTKGLSQKDLAEISFLDQVALSRLKKADDARFTTLVELGRSVGKKLIWVDDNSNIPELVNKGELF